MATKKNILPASSYAPPHTMSGGKISLKNEGYAGDNRMTLETLNPSIGGITAKARPEVKTSGITMRGAGAATKGTKSRGPMA